MTETTLTHTDPDCDGYPCAKCGACGYCADHPNCYRGTVLRDTAAVLRQYGLRDQIHPRDAVAIVYPDREYFEQSAKADREVHGNDVHGPWETDAGLVAIVDMRPQMRAQDWAVTPPDLADDWTPGAGEATP